MLGWGKIFGMFNELLFFGSIGAVVAFLLVAVRLGRGALVALIALSAVLANLFVVKQMFLFGLAVTCSDVFGVGAILGLNLLQEFFGKEEARRAVGVSFLALLFFMAMSQIHLLYLPCVEDGVHEAFATVLGATPRIVLASIGVYYVVQRLDVTVFGWLKGRFPGLALPVRMGVSLVGIQLIDTVLFSFAGLWGIVACVMDVIVFSFLMKCLIIGCSVCVVGLAKRVVGRVSV